MRPLDRFTDILPLFRPGSSVVLHSACAEPRQLAIQLAQHAALLHDVRLYTLMPMGRAPYGAATAESGLSVATFSPGKGLREAASAGRVAIMRTPLSGIPKLFDDRKLTADVLLLQLSTPEEDGTMSLGIAVDYMRAVIAQRPTVIAEINPRMPRTCGDTIVREDQVDYCLPAPNPPQAVPAATPGTAEQRIAQLVAGLITHGSIIQTGIGLLPDLVLGQLSALRDLGIHSGIIGDAVLALIESGAVTNATKKHYPGRCVTTMAAGTQRFYDKLHCNSSIEFHPCSLTHDVKLLAELEGFCAINSVLQIDLAGRANAERVDGKIISTPGGLPDFVRGATLAKNGKSIITLRATSKDGACSNIVPALAPGVPVTVTADHIDYVVTEYGVARLRGLDAAGRARALIAVAAPDFRAELRRHGGCRVAIN